MDNNLFQVNDLGVITVDTSQIQEQITQNYINALGEDLNTQSGTPQGQLIINDTTLLTEAQAQLLDICNSFSVYTATGQALDVTGGFFGYIRKTNVATVVQATLTGSQGTTISQGSIASDGTYNYILQESVVIPESGNITATFQNETPGAIPCLAGTLTQIITTITGWDSITNNVNGIVGYDIESDNIFRQRITANWLNIRANGLMGAIIDSVAQVDNVMSVVGNENYNNTQQVIDGITMTPNSIYLTVLGGNEADIAFAIYQKKTNGTGVNGDTVVGYYDDNLQRLFNYSIFRPTLTNVNIQVNYANNNYTTPDIETIIQNQITTYFNQNPLMIGQTISGNLIDTAFDNFNFANILSIKVSLTSDNWQDYLTMTNQQVAVIGTITTNLIS